MGPQDQDRRGLLRRRPLLHRLPERHRHRRRLHVGRVVPRHLRAIALYGYDGFLYCVGFLVAWLVALLLVAELLRNSGKFTMADVLAFRMRQRPVRTAACDLHPGVSLFYLLAQMAGAGALVALLLGITAEAGKNLTIAAVGVLMIFYVIVGGMKGTTWVQIIKAVLLMGGSALISVLRADASSTSTSRRCWTAAQDASGNAKLPRPGHQVRQDPVDFLSLGLALVLGTAGLPHILMRFYTVPTARTPASRSSGRSASSASST